MDSNMNYHHQPNGYPNPNMLNTNPSSYQPINQHPHHQYLPTAYQHEPASVYAPHMPTTFNPNNNMAHTTQPQPSYQNPHVQHYNNIPVHTAYHSSQQPPPNVSQWNNREYSQNQRVEYTVRNPFNSETPKKEKVSPYCLSPAKPKKTEPSLIELEQARMIKQLQNQLELTVQNCVPKVDHEAVLNQNQTIGHQNEVLFSENEKLSKQVSDLQLQLDQCNEKHKTERKGLVSDVIKWKDKFNEETTRCNVLNNEKSLVIKKLETEISQLKLNVKAEVKAKREYSSAVTVLREKTGKLTLELKESGEAHEKELKTVRKEFGDKLTEYYAQVELVNEENAGHLALIEKLQKENSELSAQNDKLKEENSNQAEKLESNMNEINEANNACLPAQPEEPGKRKDCGGACEDEIHDLWGQYRRVEKEKRKLSKGLEKVQEELQHSQQKCKKFEKKLKRKKMQVENAEKESGILEVIQSLQTKVSEALDDINKKSATIENQREEVPVLNSEIDRESNIINLKRKIDSIRKLQPQLLLMIEEDKKRSDDLKIRFKTFEAEFQIQRNDEGKDDTISENEQEEKITQTPEKQKGLCSFTRSPLSKLNK